VQPAVQPLGEGDLFLVAEGLVAEDQDGVLVHPGPDRGQREAVVNPAEIHRAHLGDEVRVEPPEGQGHDG
jgi:hypothetical protein